MHNVLRRGDRGLGGRFLGIVPPSSKTRLGTTSLYCQTLVTTTQLNRSNNRQCNRVAIVNTMHVMHVTLLNIIYLYLKIVLRTKDTKCRYNKFSFYSIIVQTVAPEGSLATEVLKVKVMHVKIDILHVRINILKDMHVRIELCT